jgi:hypothetical protein
MRKVISGFLWPRRSLIVTMSTPLSVPAPRARGVYLTDCVGGDLTIDHAAGVVGHGNR